MKPYREYEFGSISMHDNAQLRELLRAVIVGEQLEHVVETGTHEGLGSTRFLAESFQATTTPKSFVTIEASWKSWRRAKRNLISFPFVKPLWGQTLELRRALDFVQSDECIRHHERYPDIFIDDVDDPVAFYSREVRGELAGTPNVFRRLQRAIDRWRAYAGDDLLAKSLARVREQNPLVVLDSAGGTGWLEFLTVCSTMQDRPFVLLLDDVHHLKHFRSLERVRRDPAFHILGTDERHGWMLARRNGASRPATRY